MKQNKMSKYFKYAVGEILLVVIGILIALQINNWNEDRKNKQIEIALLKDFKKGLEFDILQMDSIVMQMSRAEKSIGIIIEHLNNDLPYKTTLDSEFFNSTLIFESGGMTIGAYETLKSKGLDLISNPNLLDQIILVYDEQNPWLISWEKRYTDFLFDTQKNILKTRFEDFWGGDYRNDNIIGAMKPINYEGLKTDIEYKHILKTQLNLIGWLIKKPAEQTKINAAKLLRLINDELENNNS